MAAPPRPNSRPRSPSGRRLQARCPTMRRVDGTAGKRGPGEPLAYDRRVARCSRRSRHSVEAMPSAVSRKGSGSGTRPRSLANRTPLGSRGEGGPLNGQIQDSKSDPVLQATRYFMFRDGSSEVLIRSCRIDAGCAVFRARGWKAVGAPHLRISSPGHRPMAILALSRYCMVVRVFR